MDFIVAAANLKATVYGVPSCLDREEIAQILNTIEPTIPKFVPRGMFLQLHLNKLILAGVWKKLMGAGNPKTLACTLSRKFTIPFLNIWQMA